GLSATIGASPFSLNVSPAGVYATTSITGSGISSRRKITGASPEELSSDRLLDRSNPIRPRQFPPTELLRHEQTQVEEIRSANTELLTSESLKELRRLLHEAYDERRTLTVEITTASAQNH